MIENIPKFVGFISDLTTATLGVIGVYALIFHREKINAFIRLLAQTMLNERLKKIKGALARLDSLNYETKENKKEVIALFGEIAGMIKGFTANHSGYKDCYDDFSKISDSSDALTESKKRRLSQELHCLLDDQAVVAATTLINK